MPDGDECDLGKIERRVPHLEFLMELFTDKDRKTSWDAQRIARFERVKTLMLKWWQDIQTFARQMAGQRKFQELCHTLQRAVGMIHTVESHIQESSLQLSYIRRLMAWKPDDEGVRLC